MSGFWAAEQARQLGNMIQFGTIAELDAAAARVRVTVGGNTTAWLPWLTLRAGQDRAWWAPEPGEQVVVLAPTGDMAQGLVLPGVYSDASPAPASSAEITRQQWKDGAFIQYDREAHRYDLDVPPGGYVKLRIGATTLLLEDGKATLTTPELVVDSPQSTFTGAVTVQGALEYQSGMTGTGSATVSGGDVIADGVSLKTHVHSGIQAGGSNTGQPVA